jgi:hypothetical protein
VRSNCLLFAVLLYWRLRRRWKRNLAAGRMTPVPRMIWRQSFIPGGPFHVLVGRGRRDGTLRVVSYKPAADICEKPHDCHAIAFTGRVMWGDPPQP